VPPRHGKTELLKAYIAWLLLQDPSRRIIYASYGQRFSEKKSREMMRLYQRVGGRLDPDAKSRADWRTGVDFGGLWASSVEGSNTGEGADFIDIDDPHKSRSEAESAIEREKVHQWFLNDMVTRAEPGASIVVVQTRWHPDDLAGHLIGQGWENVTLPALDAAGRALWPERYTVERLTEIRETLGEYGWASLYMQSPRPRGGALFRDVMFYDKLPETFRIGKGIDLAYTAKTRADKSAAVVLLESGGLYYVVDVRAVQLPVPEVMDILATVDPTYPGPWHWYTSSTETGVAELATATAGVTVIGERAREDKFMRAQGVAAAWNAGRVLLPRHAPWLDSFVSEVCGFVGIGDRHDDQVDALASAFQRLGGSIAMAPGRGVPAPMAIPTRFGIGTADFVSPFEHTRTQPTVPNQVTIPRGPGTAPQIVNIPGGDSPIGPSGGGWGGRGRSGW
jgi:predicted phage terminase large subunit-like protein